MKVEIAESLTLSWLRHVQGCVVTQMNWKPSPTWEIVRERELSQAFDAVRSLAGQAIGERIFKNGDFRQFLRQTEIDALGLRLSDGVGTSAVIAVDTAFHDNGLQYGDADETVGRVLKKLLRAAFALEAYVDAGEARVVFATPKMAEPIRERIARQLAMLEAVLARQVALMMPRMRFRIIANEDFSNEILQPVLERADAVADTSELFMRAQQLLKLCDAAPRTCSSRPWAERPVQSTAEAGDRIGEHVRMTIAELAATGRLTPEVVGKLLDRRYCKATFNLGLPFLKAVDPAVALSRQRIDHRGYGRYWKQPLGIGGHEFLMCSQWFVQQRDAFDRWARELR
jgi:hypothetical protein